MHSKSLVEPGVRLGWQRRPVDDLAPTASTRSLPGCGARPSTWSRNAWNRNSFATVGAAVAPYSASVAGTFLDNLNEDDRRLVGARMAVRRTARGEYLFHAGDRGDTLHVVVTGHVAIRSSTPDGDEATVTVHGPGSFFGELALLTPSAGRSAGALALDDVETMVMRANDFHELIATNPAIQRFLVDALADRVRTLTEQVMTALYVPADRRVVLRLAELADMYDAGREPIVIEIRQDDLASMAGTSRATANRVLRGLDADGLVSLRRGRLVVHHRDRLSALLG